MQTFKDSISGEVYQFEDDVVVTDTAGVYTFTTAHGIALSNLPTTLQPYSIPSPTTAQLLEKAKSDKIASLRASLIADLTGSLSVTVTSGTYDISLSDIDQKNALMAATTAEGAMKRAVAWAPSMDVIASQTVAVIGSTYLICTTTGKAGLTAPVPPTTYQTPVTDGTAAWSLLGLLIGLHPTGTAWLSPQEVVSAFAQGVNYLTGRRSHYATLKAQVFDPGADVVSVNAVTW